MFKGCNVEAIKAVQKAIRELVG